MNRLRWLVAVALAAVVPALAHAQQRGVVTGRVVNGTTNNPIPSVTVTVQGTNLRTVTNANGEYRITGMPVGTQQVSASLIGYGVGRQTVNVVAGQTATANFALQPTALELGAMVVTATGGEQRQREIGSSVAAISTEEVSLAPITSTSQLIQGRAAGVAVIQSGGTSGTGARIRIRGSNSVSLSNEPLLIIDGVRVESGAESTSLDVGGQTPSRLNDLNPEDIESIEILKGPAASALYGTAAANGVIQVRTKRGVSGRTRWSTWIEGGRIVEPNEFPLNYEAFEADGDNPLFGDLFTQDGGGVSCIRPYQEVGYCQPEEILAYTPLEDPNVDPFVDGWRGQLGMSLSGGTGNTTYYLSGEYESENGVYDPNEVRKINARANVRTELSEKLDLAVNTGYNRSTIALPQNDNNVLGIIPSGVLGYARPEVNQGYGFFTPAEFFAIDVNQNVDRFTGSVQANWKPVLPLRFNLTAGLDQVFRFDEQTTPPNVVDFGTSILGDRISNRYRIANYTVNGSGTFTWSPNLDLATTTSVGFQYNQDLFQGTLANGVRLLAGTGSLNGVTDLFGVGETTLDTRTLGGFVSEQLAWQDRAFLNLALRGDQNSAFGDDYDFAIYPSASASFVAVDNGFATLRLRGALGKAGLAPGPLDAIRYLVPTAVSLGRANVPGFTIGGVGKRDLKPEVSTEYELGFETSVFADRLGLDFTWYHKTSEDALIDVPIVPSAGVVASRLENIGEVRNTGVEAALRGNLINNENVGLEFTLNFSTNDNELVSLGRRTEPIIFGLGTDTQRHAEGFALGGYWQRPIVSYDDADGDGFLAANEVVIGDTAEYLGTPFPTRELQFTPTLTLFRNIRISALFDHRGGQKLYDATGDFRCGSFYNCQAAVDPNAPLEEQAAYVALTETGSVAGFIEDASFTKLREVSVTLTAPERFARVAGARGLSLTLAGRNLATWTDYTGVDPEVSYSGQTNFLTADFFTQPPVRYYTARIDLSF